MTLSPTYEGCDELCESVRLLHVDAMAARGDYFQPRVWQRLDLSLASAERDDFVISIPNYERRRTHRAKQVRHSLAVHVRLPGDAEAHFAADVPHLELVY